MCLNLSTKKTRERKFLGDRHRVPWSTLVRIVQPHAPRAKTGRPPFTIETMLRIQVLQPWFGLSDPAMEEAPREVSLYRDFAGLGDGVSRLPDETTGRADTERVHLCRPGASPVCTAAKSWKPCLLSGKETGSGSFCPKLNRVRPKSFLINLDDNLPRPWQTIDSRFSPAAELFQYINPEANRWLV